DDVFGKIRMRVNPRADSSSAKRQLAQASFDRGYTFDGKSDLRRVSAKCLSQSHWRRVLQVRSPDFHDILKLVRLGLQLRMQPFKSRAQVVYQQTHRPDVY